MLIYLKRNKSLILLKENKCHPVLIILILWNHRSLWITQLINKNKIINLCRSLILNRNQKLILSKNYKLNPNKIKEKRQN